MGALRKIRYSYSQEGGKKLKNLVVRAGLNPVHENNPVVGTFQGPGVTGGEHYVDFDGAKTVEYLMFQLQGEGRLQVNGVKPRITSTSKSKSIIVFVCVCERKYFIFIFGHILYIRFYFRIDKWMGTNNLQMYSKTASF